MSNFVEPLLHIEKITNSVATFNSAFACDQNQFYTNVIFDMYPSCDDNLMEIFKKNYAMKRSVKTSLFYDERSLFSLL